VCSPATCPLIYASFKRRKRHLRFVSNNSDVPLMRNEVMLRLDGEMSLCPRMVARVCVFFFVRAGGLGLRPKLCPEEAVRDAGSEGTIGFRCRSAR